MNKLVIPAILAGAVLVAGMFALMPVGKASTVHTTILASTGKQISGTFTSTAAGSTVTIFDAGTGKVANVGLTVAVKTTTVGATIHINCLDKEGNQVMFLSIAPTVAPANAGFVTDLICHTVTATVAANGANAGVISIEGVALQGA